MAVQTLHPCAAYADEEGWTQPESARFFRLPLSSYKQLVGGFYRPSWQRARAIEKRSRGEILAEVLLKWHEKHPPPEYPKPAEGAA